MVNCHICGKEFKNTQGLAGHMSFKHGIKSASAGAAPAARLATEQDLKQINYRTEQIEASTVCVKRDFNGDGRITTLDALCALQMAVGKRTEGAC